MTANLFSCVGAYSRGLDTLAHILTKGADFAVAKGGTKDDVLGWRLIDDMHPVRFQAFNVINFARQWPARAVGATVPAGLDGELTFDQVMAAISEAKAELAKFTAAQFEGRDEVPVTMNIGQEMTFPTSQFVVGFATPNYYFHLSMAYAILRAKGVELGKRDFFAGGL